MPSEGFTAGPLKQSSGRSCYSNSGASKRCLSRENWRSRELKVFTSREDVAMSCEALHEVLNEGSVGSRPDVANVQGFRSDLTRSRQKNPLQPPRKT